MAGKKFRSSFWGYNKREVFEYLYLLDKKYTRDLERKEKEIESLKEIDQFVEEINVIDENNSAAPKKLEFPKPGRPRPAFIKPTPIARKEVEAPVIQEAPVSPKPFPVPSEPESIDNPVYVQTDEEVKAKKRELAVLTSEVNGLKKKVKELLGTLDENLKDLDVDD